MTPDPDVHTRLDELLRAEAAAIYRAQAHLFGLLPPDGELGWDVDLAAPRFTARLGDRVVVEGPVQLVGTWSARDRSWMWGDRNPSVAAAGTERMFARLGDVAALQPIRGHALRLNERVAGRLATLCAIKTGWFAAWPGRTGDAVAWLAILPTVWPGAPVETVDRTWCTLCGRVRKEARALIAGPGVLLCDRCVTTLADVVAARTGPAAEAPPGMPPCLFCGKTGPRTFSAHAAVCHECTALCDDIIREGA